MVISVGPPCEALDNALGPYTEISIVDAMNPANESGVIDYICIRVYSVTVGASIKVGVCYSPEYLKYATRGCSNELVCIKGKNEFYAPDDFSAFSVEKGDFVCVYCKDGINLEMGMTDGTGVYVGGGNVCTETVKMSSYFTGWRIACHLTGPVCPDPIASFTHSGEACI